MKPFAKGLIAALVAGTCSLATQAADVMITIDGKVTAAACTINNSGYYQVPMDDVTTATLSPANSYGNWKPFEVTLSSCPAGITRVTATFDGTPDTNDSSKYASATGVGYATRTAVQLQNRTGTVANKGKNSTMTVNVAADRSATFDLQARPYSALGGATEGIIRTVVMMNFAYN